MDTKKILNRQAKIFTIKGEEAGFQDLESSIFSNRIDKKIIQMVIKWQLAKRRSGSHSTKNISAVNGSTRKIRAQKGGGCARHGHRHAPQFRGGGVSHGPVPHSHEFDLNKKIKKLGLSIALSAKAEAGKIFLINSLDFERAQTRVVNEFINCFKQKTESSDKKYLFVGTSKSEQQNTLFATANIKTTHYIPAIGLNVYDVVNCDSLFFFPGAIEKTIKKCILPKKDMKEGDKNDKE